MKEYPQVFDETLDQMSRTQLEEFIWIAIARIAPFYTDTKNIRDINARGCLTRLFLLIETGSAENFVYSPKAR